MKQVILGKTEYGEIIEAETTEAGLIRGFNGYDLISSDRSYDQNTYLNMCLWTHNVNIKGVVLTSGCAIPESWTVNLSTEELEEIEGAYKNEGVYCSECGTFHDSDQYMNVSYKIIECEVFCNECVNSDELLIELNDPQDLFKAKSIESMDNPESYEEIETLFCDSSGFGSPTEPALTKTQAHAKAQELIDSHSEPLFIAITGIGQFQVYVTVYKRI